MRNPLPVLAAALLTVAGAFAADLPTWKVIEEPFGAWRVVEFTDASGGYHHLYCRWSECGVKVTKGQVPLYVLEKAGDEAYTAYGPYNPQYAETYAGKTWEWLKGKTTSVHFQSTKTTWKSEASHFVLDMGSKPNKAVIPGTDVAIAVDPEHAAVSPTGWIFKVLPPVAVADDAPKPAPKPTPGQTPTPKPKPKHPGTTHPAPKPGAHAATELSGLERGWMIPAERSAYDDSILASKKPTAAALQAAYKKGRETVAANLRDELKAPYNDLVKGGQFDQIDDLLKGKNYSGFEMTLRPEEYEALKKVLKTADAHTDFAAPNAAAQYDLEMKVILSPEGKPKSSEHLMAHRIAEKFRAMLPKAPGQKVDPAAPLTDDDWARITDKADRDALKKQYDADFAKADTPDAKAKVNQDYRGKIDAWVAKHPASAPSSQPFDPAKIDTLDKLKALAPEDQKKFCSMNSDTSPAGSCNDFLDAADAGMKQCLSESGAKPEDKVATLKARNACVAKLHPDCKPASAPAARRSLADLPKDMQAYCANLLAGATDPDPAAKSRTGGGSAVDSSPCPGAKNAAKGDASKPGDDVESCKKKDEKKDDPNFYTNVGNGIAFGIGGLLLASFLGGPALMLAVGIAAGIGGYYFAKTNDEPKKKDKK